MRYTHLFASLLALLTFAAAWPWPPTLPNIQALQRVDDFLARRQGGGGGGDGGNNGGDGGNGGNNGGNSQTNGDSTQSGDAGTTTTSGGDQSTSQTDSKSSVTPPPKSGDKAKETSTKGGDSSTDGGDKNSTDTSSTSSISVPANAVGGVNMITPATSAVATQYYSVGSTITWAWNYTSLAKPPKYIDIVASMSGSGSQAVQSPITLATNESWHSTQNYTWDTNAFHSQTPLGVGIYALQVYDAEAGISATPSPGHLGVNINFQFGMYTGQTYTALSNPYICATCNAASSLLQPSVLKMALGTSSLVIGSFVYFGAAWGALW